MHKSRSELAGAQKPRHCGASKEKEAKELEMAKVCQGTCVRLVCSSGSSNHIVFIPPFSLLSPPLFFFSFYSTVMFISLLVILHKLVYLYTSPFFGGRGGGLHFCTPSFFLLFVFRSLRHIQAQPTVAPGQSAVMEEQQVLEPPVVQRVPPEKHYMVGTCTLIMLD